jgi:hypothetical protein
MVVAPPLAQEARKNAANMRPTKRCRFINGESFPVKVFSIRSRAIAAAILLWNSSGSKISGFQTYHRRDLNPWAIVTRPNPDKIKYE